jgi:hypothetical protein
MSYSFILFTFCISFSLSISQQDNVPHTVTCDTPRPVERDGLLSIGGTLTVFPKEPHEISGGCMYNLTQTTGNQSSQGRICPPTTSVLANLCRYVGATSLRLDHAPTREAKRALQNTSVPCLSGRSRPTGLYRTYERNQHGYLFVALLYYSITKQGKRKPNHPCPNKERRFHPVP